MEFKQMIDRCSSEEEFKLTEQLKTGKYVGDQLRI